MSAGTPETASGAPCALIIPAYNPELPLLRSALAYFLDHERELVGEIIVIDDGSREPITREALLGERLNDPAAARLRIERQSNQGVGSARNRAVELTEAPVVVFLDSDCLPQAGWVAALTRPIRDGSAVLACGTTLTYDMKPLIAQYADFMGYLREPVRHRGKIANAVQANFAVARAAYREIGGFEVRLRRTQDLDFTWRLIQRGDQDRIVYVPEAVVLHKHRDTVRKFLKQGYQSGQGGMAFCRLRGRDPREVWVLRPTVGGVLVQCVVMVVLAWRCFARAVKRHKLNHRVIVYPAINFMRSCCYNWGAWTFHRRWKRSGGELIFDL